MKDKMFIVRKWVKAQSATDAIRKEKKQAPDEVFIDLDWKQDNAAGMADAIGFKKR